MMVENCMYLRDEMYGKDGVGAWKMVLRSVYALNCLIHEELIEFLNLHRLIFGELVQFK
jgi:hypothetical protein